MDGDHTIEQSWLATTRVLEATFHTLVHQNVELEGTLLKPNMVLSGYSCPVQASVEDVAGATVRCFQWTVPAGGARHRVPVRRPDRRARHRAPRRDEPPWARTRGSCSFSYGRALQAPALKAWKGDPANVPAAQQAFLLRARLNSAARSGSYSAEMEKAA